MTRPTLDYARPVRKPLTLWRIAIWLMPAWCFLMTFGVFMAAGHEIDLIWWLAMGLPLIVAAACFWLEERLLGIYCIGVCLLVLAVTIALPSINRAT